MSIFRDIDAKTFEDGITRDPEAELIDVRTPPEYQSGHIPKARLMNIMDADFTARIEKLDKEKAYYLYCRSGVRSANACRYMATRGFKKVFNLAPGIIGWNGNIKK